MACEKKEDKNYNQLALNRGTHTHTRHLFKRRAIRKSPWEHGQIRHQYIYFYGLLNLLLDDTTTTTTTTRNSLLRLKGNPKISSQKNEGQFEFVFIFVLSRFWRPVRACNRAERERRRRWAGLGTWSRSIRSIFFCLFLSPFRITKAHRIRLHFHTFSGLTLEKKN